MTHQRYRWWILGVSTLTQLAAALASQGIGAWGVYAQDVLGLSARQIGALATVSSLVPIVGLALIGPVLDRVGERMPVFLGMLVLALSMEYLLRARSEALCLLMVIVLSCSLTRTTSHSSKMCVRCTASGLRFL